MKSLRISGLVAIAAVLFSCTPASLDPLDGTHQEKQAYTFTTGTCQTSAKTNNIRHFTVTLENAAENNTLVLDFIGAKWFLQAASYKPVANTDLRGGAYAFETSSFNGDPLGKYGLVNVTKNGDNYTISGTVWAQDGRVMDISWEGTITGFVPEEELIQLDEVKDIGYNEQSQSISFKLSTGIWALDYPAPTYLPTYSGNANFLALELYSADGKLHEGTYNAGQYGSLAANQYLPGYDNPYIGAWGANQATCWFSIENDVMSAEKISAGNLEVKHCGGNVWNISMHNSVCWVEFEGEIADLTPSVDYNLAEDTFTEGTDYDTHILTITTEKSAPVATIELYTAKNAKTLAGTYEVSSTAAAGKIKADSWFMSGSDKYLVKSGDITIGDYSQKTGRVLTVTADAITSQKDADTSAGPTTLDIKDIACDWIPEPTYLELTKCLSATSNIGSFILPAQTITLKLATEAKETDWVANDFGDYSIVMEKGYYLALDLYSADRTLALGTYKPCTTGGTVGEGEFGIGYDAEVLGSPAPNKGTCWWTSENGTTTTEKITDSEAVVTVAKKKGKYVISIVSSVVNARYTGDIEIK